MIKGLPKPVSYLPIRIKIPEIIANIAIMIDSPEKVGIKTVSPHKIKKIANSKNPILLVIIIEISLVDLRDFT